MSTVDRTRTHAAVSAVAAAEQQPDGWRFVPDTILPGYQWAPQWVLARTPTVHWGPISGKAVGGPNTVQHSSTVQKHANTFLFVFFFFSFSLLFFPLSSLFSFFPFFSFFSFLSPFSFFLFLILFFFFSRVLKISFFGLNCCTYVVGAWVEGSLTHL